MQLLYAKPSPFARKARVLLRERGLQDRILEVPVAPYESPTELIAANPASKVPALRLDDGKVIIESNLIAAHLDSLGSHPALVPLGQHAAQLQCWGRAEALTAAALTIVLEGRRDAALRSEAWVARQNAAIERTLAALELGHGDLASPLGYAHIVLGAALGFLDFRLPVIAWRDAQPRLATWFAEFSQRPSMLATAPA